MATAWTRLEVESLADPRSFARGLVYQRDGRIEIGRQDTNRVTAVVRGSRPYDVELRRDPKRSWSCTCPVGEEGKFCKHCVAVALHFADVERAPKPTPTKVRGDSPDLRRYLAGLDPDELVGLLVEQAEADWRLRERLTARAIALETGSVDVKSWKRRLDAAFGDRRHFVPYAEAGGWAQDIFEVIDALGDLLDAGHAATVAELVEYAHRRADASV